MLLVLLLPEKDWILSRCQYTGRGRETVNTLWADTVQQLIVFSFQLGVIEKIP